MKNFIILLLMSLMHYGCQKQDVMQDPCASQSPTVIKYAWRFPLPMNHFSPTEIIGKVGNKIICRSTLNSIAQLVIYDVANLTFQNVPAKFYKDLYFLTDNYFYYYEAFAMYRINIATLDKVKIYSFDEAFFSIRAEYINDKIFFTQVEKNSGKLTLVEYDEVTEKVVFTITKNYAVNFTQITTRLWYNSNRYLLYVSTLENSEITIDKIDVQNQSIDSIKIENSFFQSIYSLDYPSGTMYKKSPFGYIIYDYMKDVFIDFPTIRNAIYFDHQTFQMDTSCYDLNTNKYVVNAKVPYSLYINSKFYHSDRINLITHIVQFNPASGCIEATLEDISHASLTFFRQGDTSILFGSSIDDHVRNYFYGFEL